MALNYKTEPGPAIYSTIPKKKFIQGTNSFYQKLKEKEILNKIKKKHNNLNTDIDLVISNYAET